MVTKNEVKLMIEESEKNIINVISGNHLIHNEKIDKLIDKINLLSDRINKIENKTTLLESKVMNLEEQYKLLQKENVDLQESLLFTQEELVEKKLHTMQKESDAEFDRLYENYEYLKDENRKLEDRTRRCNLRIDGIAEDINETWENTEEKAKKVFGDQLGLTSDIEIERAHRMNIRPNNNNNIRENKKVNRPRTIILKLLRYKDKQLILQNSKKLKDTGIYIYEDFSDETNRIRKDLKEQMKQERDKGKYCVINYDRLIIKEFRNPRVGYGVGESSGD